MFSLTDKEIHFYKYIKHTNSFIIRRRQRKLRKSSKNRLSRSRVSCLESWLPPIRWVPGFRSRIPIKVPSFVSHFLDVRNIKDFSRNYVLFLVLKSTSELVKLSISWIFFSVPSKFEISRVNCIPSLQKSQVSSFWIFCVD